jgi:hypothetical protein
MIVARLMAVGRTGATNRAGLGALAEAHTKRMCPHEVAVLFGNGCASR